MELNQESDLEKLAVPFLKSQNLKYCWQVPISNRVIDLAAIDTDGNLVGIEFKLHNWARAIKQAENHYNGFDYLYIFIPEKKFRKNLVEKAKEKGIGILLLSKESTIIKKLEANKNKNKWLPKSNYIKNYIMEMGEKYV